MPVVQLKANSRYAEPLLTLYVVQSHWLDRGRLVEGKLQQFASMESALRAGKQAERRSPFVRVTRVRGNVDADYWEDPITVAKFGDECPAG